MNIIDQIRESGSKVLGAVGDGVELASHLKHNKSGLETLLAVSIAELRFKPKDEKDFRTIVCTSNTRLIKVFQAIKEKDKKKALATTPFVGIKTRDSTSILTFNLISNTYNTISLRAWELGGIVPLSEKNLEALDMILSDLLKKQSRDDQKEDSMIFS